MAVIEAGFLKRGGRIEGKEHLGNEQLRHGSVPTKPGRAREGRHRR